jgi:hypothetical protein
MVGQMPAQTLGIKGRPAREFAHRLAIVVFHISGPCYSVAAAKAANLRTRNPMKRPSIFGLLAPMLALGSACGSYPPPTERMTTSEAAIRAADEMGAGQVPRAALHLKLAQEQTESARKLIEDGYNERAELTLKRAQADGELALAIAKEHTTVERAQQARAKLDELRAGSSTAPAAAPSKAKAGQ